MVTRRRVEKICIRSEYYAPHERLEYISGIENGITWQITEMQAVAQIIKQTHDYYIVLEGREIPVVIARHGNDIYLKTATDGYSPDNLLKLPKFNINFASRQ